MLSDRCLFCPVCLVLSVCDVGVLWPNSWMDQDETWHAGRPRPHCVRWTHPLSRGAEPPRPPQFSTHICCDQMAAWIKMALAMEAGLGPDDFVLDGGPAPPSQKGAEPPKIFQPICIVAKQLGGSRWHLALR